MLQISAMHSPLAISDPVLSSISSTFDTTVARYIGKLAKCNKNEKRETR